LHTSNLIADAEQGFNAVMLKNHGDVLFTNAAQCVFRHLAASCSSRASLEHSVATTLAFCTSRDAQRRDCFT
jgi:predicted TIM-barrel enzyme